MSLFAYTAKRSLIPGHVVGLTYEVELGIADAVLSVEDIKTVQRSQGGAAEECFYRQDRSWTITFAPVRGAQRDLLREFLDSTESGQLFTVKLYGNEVTALGLRRIESGHSEPSFIRVSTRNADWFHASITAITNDGESSDVYEDGGGGLDPKISILTSRLYPIEDIQEMTGTGVPVKTHFVTLVEALEPSAIPLDGELNTILRNITLPPFDAIESSNEDIVLEGTLSDALRAYEEYPPEAIDSFGGRPQSGTLEQILISYEEYPSEALDGSGTILAGTLTGDEPPEVFPNLYSVTSSSVDTAVDPHTVDLPTFAVGDLALIVATFANVPTVTTPSGWTLVATYADSTLLNVFVYSRVIDGTEGPTVTLDLSAIRKSARLVLGIEAGTYGAGIEHAGSSGVTNAPNPPSLTPSWGEDSTLWIAIYGARAAVSTTSSYPLPDNHVMDASSSGGTGGLAPSTIGICSQQLTVDALDPAAFAISSNVNGVALTLAIQPP